MRLDQRLALTLSMAALLGLTACDAGDEPAVEEPAETVVVEEEEPVFRDGAIQMDTTEIGTAAPAASPTAEQPQ